MPKFFISYRREDSQALTGRIFDRLALRYGRQAIYRDVDTNIPGTNVRNNIREALRQSDALIAIIGPRWLGSRSWLTWKTRLDDEEDWVRIEIETALRLQVYTIPLLIDGAKMPKAADLPASLRELPDYHALPIDPGLDFDQHLARLIRALDAFLETNGTALQARRQAEDERREREAAEVRRKAADEQREREAAEARRKAEDERREREAAEARSKAEDERREREAAEARRKADDERREHEAAEARSKAEDERREREAAEARRKAEDERREHEAAETRRKAEDERRDREAAEARRKAEDERREHEAAEARRKAQDEWREREAAEARRKAEDEWREREAAEARRKAEDDERAAEAQRPAEDQKAREPHPPEAETIGEEKAASAPKGRRLRKPRQVRKPDAIAAANEAAGDTEGDARAAIPAAEVPADAQPDEPRNQLPEDQHKARLISLLEISKSASQQIRAGDTDKPAVAENVVDATQPQAGPTKQDEQPLPAAIPAAIAADSVAPPTPNMRRIAIYGAVALGLGGGLLALAQTWPFVDGTTCSLEGQSSYDAVIRACERDLQGNPENPQARRTRAIAYFRNADYRQAVAAFSDLINKGFNTPEMFDYRRQSYEELGEMEAALRDYDRQIQLAPTAPKPQLDGKYAAKYADVYIQRGLNSLNNAADTRAAINAFTSALALNPPRDKRFEALNYRRLARHKASDIAAALQDYEQMKQIEPTKARSLLDLGTARAYADIYFKQAEEFVSKRDPVRAIEQYSLAIETQPTALAYLQRGRAQLANPSSPKIDAAIADFSAVLAIDFNSNAAWRGRAIARSRKGDYEAAVADFTQAIKLDGKDVDSYDGRRRAYEKLPLPNFRAALEDFTAATKLSPNYRAGAPLDPRYTDALRFRGGAFSYLGRIYLESVSTGQLPEIVNKERNETCLEKARSAGVLNNYKNIGLTCYELALPDYDEINNFNNRDYTHALVLNARCWARGMLWQNPDQLKLALDDCVRAEDLLKAELAAPKTGFTRTKVNADLFSARDSHGFILLKMGQHSAAIPEYDAVIEFHDPSDSSNADNLAKAYYGRALAKRALRQRGAEDDVERAKRFNKNIAALFEVFGFSSTTR